MPKSTRPWNEDAVAKLKAMAGKEPWERIGAVLGRTRATAVQASKQGLSLRVKRPSKTKTDEDGAPAEAFFNVLGIE